MKGPDDLECSFRLENSGSWGIFVNRGEVLRPARFENEAGNAASRLLSAGSALLSQAAEGRFKVPRDDNCLSFTHVLAGSPECLEHALYKMESARTLCPRLQRPGEPAWHQQGSGHPQSGSRRVAAWRPRAPRPSPGTGTTLQRPERLQLSLPVSHLGWSRGMVGTCGCSPSVTPGSRDVRAISKDFHTHHPM